MGNRILHDSIRTSRSIGNMTDFQFRTWTYLLTYVDDYGRGSADPELLKGLVFTRRKGVTEATIEKTLAELANMGSIRLYEVDGDRYFCFPTWGDHQRVQQKRSLFPAPPNEGDGKSESTVSHGESRWVTVGHGESRWVTVSHGESPPELEVESEVESELEVEGLTVTDVTVCRTKDVRRVLEAWNSLGLQTIKQILPDTDRGKMLRKRVNDYGIDDVLAAIEKVRSSSFLTGDNKNGWQATFDWFIKPNNFPKVLSGNYDNTNKPKSKSSNVFLDLVESGELNDDG